MKLAHGYRMDLPLPKAVIGQMTSWLSPGDVALGTEWGQEKDKKREVGDGEPKDGWDRSRTLSKHLQLSTASLATWEPKRINAVPSTF